MGLKTRKVLVNIARNGNTTLNEGIIEVTPTPQPDLYRVAVVCKTIPQEGLFKDISYFLTRREAEALLKASPKINFAITR